MVTTHLAFLRACSHAQWLECSLSLSDGVCGVKRGLNYRWGSQIIPYLVLVTFRQCVG
ncbi:hypothetical protein BDN67DRAFT_645926 [Paxillus ammoniavirescens]|nr:hypothetical protein BDN67DRAFT_645926 [Paxillus ammoniavirescens]